MKHSLYSEEQLLDEAFRKKVILDILSENNKARKRESKKRQEIYRDMTVKWVLLGLKKEGLKPETLQLMENRSANISIFRRVIKKLARSYSGDITREGLVNSTVKPLLNEQIQILSDLLDFDQKQMKADRFSCAQKNALALTLPEKVTTVDGKDLYRLKQVVLAPWQYDVIPKSKDKESAGAVILSDYEEISSAGIFTSDIKTSTLQNQQVSRGITEHQEVIAQPVGNYDSLQEPNCFIWWSDKYHFTTDKNGKILKDQSPDDLENPIQILPGETIAENQDGEYWGSGGGDLVDGSILVNTLLTDMFSIAYMQGWGQMVIIGENIKENIQIGPHSALILEYSQKKDETKPEVSIVNANPPLDQWMAAIEQYVALLLSTNELSPANVAVRLDPASFPSGIAMLVERSEATNDINQKRKMFRVKEMNQWEIIKRWHNKYQENGSLIPDFQDIGRIDEAAYVKVKFSDRKEVITEKERLELLKLRKDLGLNTMLDLIKLDNPGMDDVEAQKKLKEILEEKLKGFAKEANTIIESNIGDNSVDNSEEEAELDEEGINS